MAINQGTRAILLFLGSLAVFVAAVTRHRAPWRAVDLRFGTLLEERATGVPSIARLIRGQWYFFAVGTLEQDGPVLKSLQRLIQLPEMRTGNLVPRALIDGEEQAVAIDKFRRENEIEYEIGALHELSAQELAPLGLNSHQRRFFLIDPDLRVVFYSEWLRPTDLRQLLVKHFGDLEDVAADRPLGVGDRVEIRSPVEVGGSTAPFEVRSSLMLIFTSKCVSCALENRLSQVSLHQEILQAAAALEGRRPVLIFSPSFVARELRLRLADAKIPIPAYLSAGLEGIEDPGGNRPLHGRDLLVLRTNDDGRVESLEDWDQFLDSMTKAVSRGARS